MFVSSIFKAARQFKVSTGTLRNYEAVCMFEYARNIKSKGYSGVGTQEMQNCM